MIAYYVFINIFVWCFAWNSSWTVTHIKQMRKPALNKGHLEALSELSTISNDLHQHSYMELFYDMSEILFFPCGISVEHKHLVNESFDLQKINPK